MLAIFISSCHTVEPPTPPPEYDSIDQSPVWSPNGKWIAYFHFNRDVNDHLYSTGLYIIDTNGVNRKIVFAGNAYSPNWSPDNKEIVFRYDEVYTIKIDGTDLREITTVGQAYFPSWSRDGNKIAFDTDYKDSAGAKEIWIVNKNGTGLKDISQHGTGEWRMPDWSPDGKDIVHIRPPGIFVMDSTGNNPKRLTYNGIYDLYPKYSYNGEKITWTSGNDRNQIWIMNSDGTNQYYLTEGSYSSWSPDNTTIVYTKPINNKIALFIINIKTKIIKQLTF